MNTVRAIKTTLQLVGLLTRVLLGAVAISGIQGSIVILPPITSLFLESVTAIIAFVLWFNRTGAAFRNAPPRKSASLFVVVWTVVLVNAVGASLWSLIPPEPSPIGEAMNRSSGSAAAGIVMLFVVAPQLEEALFRGYFLSRLCANVHRVTAVLISAAVFAVVHVEPAMIVGLFAAGIVLAMIVICTGRIWLAVFAHSAINMASLLPGTSRLTVAANRAGAPFFMASAALALLAATLLWRKLHHTDWHTPSA